MISEAVRRQVELELARRQDLKHQVQAACKRLFDVIVRPEHRNHPRGPHKQSMPYRVGRDKVNVAICNELRLVLNNDSCRTIAAALDELGVVRIQVKGKQYYRGLEERR